MNSFTVREIAALYRVTQHTVLAWIKSGELVAFHAGRNRIAGKPRWRVRAQALAQFESSRTPEPERPSRPRRNKQQGQCRTWY